MGKRVSMDRVDCLKVEICGYFVDYLEKKGMEQQVLAKKLKLNGALLSKIVRYQYQEFSLERLIRILNQIRPEIVLVLKKTSGAKKKKRKNS